MSSDLERRVVRLEAYRLARTPEVAALGAAVDHLLAAVEIAVQIGEQELLLDGLRTKGEDGAKLAGMLSRSWSGDPAAWLAARRQRAGGCDAR